MTTYRIENARSGQSLGTYQGETALHAIASVHRDAGYRAEVVDGEIVVGSDAPDWLIADPVGSLVATEIVTERTECRDETVDAEIDSPAGLGAAHGAEDRRHDEGDVLDEDGVPTPAPYRAPIAWNRAGAEQEYRAAYRAARGE